MSGGSWGYLYSRVEEAAHELQESSDPLRAAFGQHLIKCAHALHEIEWVDSCDSSPPADTDAIREVFGDDADKVTLDVVLVRAREVSHKLTDLITTLSRKEVQNINQSPDHP